MASECPGTRSLTETNPFSSLFVLGKASWPELVRRSGEAAAAAIERENPNVNAIVLLEGSPATLNFRCDRVWVWVNTHGVVTEVPIVG